MLSLHTSSSLLSALGSLDRTSSALAVSQTRLSTGYRINSAQDDAAGLQLATRLASQSSGMTVAMRNTQNAVSMLQTADSLMGEVGNILDRMSDLAITAADDSASDDDRAALDKEYATLSEQVLSVLHESSYGGKYLMRYVVAPPGPNGPGTMGSGPLSFQIGASSEEAVTEDFRPGLGRLNVSLYYAINNGNLAGQPLDAPGTELTSSTSANALIDKIADASKDASALRSQFGALGNRLDSVYRNLSNMSTNVDAVRGRIMDVDYASETATMTANQMLAQAGTAMVKNSLSSLQLIKFLID
jgi:flagellin